MKKFRYISLITLLFFLNSFKSKSQNDDDDSSNNGIIGFHKLHSDKTICYCNGGDRSQENKIREAQTCKNLGIDLKFGIGGIHKLESSSNLTKNYLSETEYRPWGSLHIIAKGTGYQIKEMNIKPGKNNLFNDIRIDLNIGRLLMAQEWYI